MLINGQENELISANDRGLLYGDGLFETLTVIDGQPQRWQQHMARLALGCERLKLEMPDSALLLKEVISECADRSKAVAKIIITRGEGARGYKATTNPTSRIVQSSVYPDYPASYAEQGIVTRICDLRLAQQPLLAGIKHLNRLENVLARNEWQDPDITEGLLQDVQGNFIEGTMSNLFVINDDVLYTDPLLNCGVAGIMRESIIKCAERLKINFQLQAIDKTLLSDADELFVCNSLIGIWPIKQIIQLKKFPVGPITLQLKKSLRSFNGYLDS